MRIAFVGTSGVGKTTLAEALLALPEFQGYYHIKERSRTIINNFGKKSPREISDEEEMKEFQLALVRSQIGEEGLAGSYITDRSFVDKSSEAHKIVRDQRCRGGYARLC